MNKMTRAEAREFIRNNPEQYLIKANKKGYICPICRNGEGKNGTGLEHKPSDKTHFTCFKCNQIINNDVIDIIAIEHGLQAGSKEAFKKAYEIYNIEIVDNKQTLGGQNLDKRATGYQQKTDTNTTKNTQETEINKTNSKQNEGLKMIQKYIKDSHESLRLNQDEAFKYLIGRGLTEDIIYNFNIGYDLKKNCVVIPYSKDIKHCNYYILRNINGNKDNRYRKPPSEQTGIKEPIFNVEDMHQNIEPVFVVESPFCALSIIQEGFKCVSIGGTGGRKLTDYIKDNEIKPSLILALDKEPSGQEAQEKLYKELLNLNIDVVNSDDFYSSQVKDPNEYIQENKENLKKWLDNEVLKIKDYKTYYKQNQSLMNYLNTFEKEFEKEGEKPISTGFKTLDNFLDGGLFAGLYCIGGISSLGKTTFTLQIADQIAESGQDVLIFSLEMSKREILAKSLSRLIMKLKSDGKATGKTTRDILKGGKNWGKEEKENFKISLNQYRSISKNIYIYEGVGDIGVKEISEKAYRHYEITGNTPVIIIDYLQILAPYDHKMTDKQNTDKNVIELKRLSRDLKTPIVVISSFNRENYNNTVSMASFKESGAIEYSSDVLIGLQFNFMRQAEKDENGKDRSDKDKKNFIDEEREKAFEKAKNGKYQKINLKVLKNRNGNKGDLIFKYCPMFNEFIEEELQEIKDKEGNTIATEDKTTYSSNIGFIGDVSKFKRG